MSGHIVCLSLHLPDLPSPSLLTSLMCDPPQLNNDCMHRVKFTSGKPFVWVILVIWSASLSNMMGATRVPQATAADIVFGPFLTLTNKGTRNDNPIAGALVTFDWA